MEAQELDRFDGSSLTVFRKEKTSVKTPKTPEDKQAFFSWLKERGMFDSIITVNSQTLNSLYREELEVAIAKGNYGFSIPGLREVSVYYDLSVRAR